MVLALPLLLILPDAAMIAISVGLSIGVVVTALFYMLAYAFQHPPLIALAKEELAALLYSIVIVAFWLASSATINPIAVAMIAPNLGQLSASGLATQAGASGLGTSHVTLAIASLDILIEKLRSMYVSMYLYEALIGFLSTISFPLGSPIPAVSVISFSITPFDGLNLLSNAHTIIVETIGQMLTFVMAKQFILIFARDSIPLIFLPLGLVFRSIPFLRTTGSSIIAICFAAYFVLPFAVLFSNFVIFNVYQPADFMYMPEHIGPYKSDLDPTKVQAEIDTSKSHGNTDVLHTFTAKSVADSSSSQYECAGNGFARMWCAAENMLAGAASAAKGFATNVFGIWKFMMGMTGDFLSVWANPLLPSSATAGLFYFVIDAVVSESQFLVLVLITSVIEMIFTITMYRNIAMLIGGEMEIAGLSKII